ncbi:hypothetical protein Ahy_B10g104141 [Arachis hypogaea]|uniref:CCHC-type domain-containing protein n=1 Tax=Arachis hypogaea TaxID=3818 RepID=A0A444X4T9_ARAHY|nr:hypothetical protein Ahy_B10g104141 [Arachis hypogaea]
MMHGFAVRLDEVRCDSDGCIVMRQIVCNRAGSRKEEVEKDERIRDHQPLTRSCYRARIRARLDRKIHKWMVVSFYEEHSHGLVDPLDVNMMPEYRTFSFSDKAQAKNLHDIGIRTCHIMGYLAAQKVDMQICHSTKKILLVTSLPTLEGFAIKTFTRNMFREVRKEIKGACAMNTKLVIQDGGKLYFKCNIFGMPEIDHVVEFDRVRGMLRCTEYSRLMDVACKNSSDFVEAMNEIVNTITKLQKQGENPCNGNLDDDYIVDPLVVKSKGAPKKNSKFKQQRKCSNCSVTGHYNKSCPNVPCRISKEPADDDTKKNNCSHLDMLTKHKRHDNVKNQQKMEKGRDIGGGTAPTSAAKSAFTDQLKTSSPGLDIPVCASTSNEEFGMISGPAESPVVALITGMAD